MFFWHSQQVFKRPSHYIGYMITLWYSFCSLLLFHDLLLWSYLYHCVWSGI